ncbi:MAG: hypothetical protein PHU72_00015 [Dethiosulfovibrio sp.]|nr:hypothetical protein [Dethiosulfovibrio sp.]
MREITAPALPEGYVEFVYNRELRALVGTWSGRVLLQNPPELGQDWDVPGIMEKGILCQANRQGNVEDGRSLWAVSGYDAGFRLMKSPVLPHQLNGSSVGSVLSEVVKECGLKVDVTLAADLPVDARPLATGQTAANVVLDLSAMAGAIAYMLPDGTLKVAPPRPCGKYPCKGLMLDHVESRSLDMDGYASGVVVVLGRRGDAPDGSDDDPNSKPGWNPGVTPSGSLKSVTKWGTTALPGGTLSWRYTMLTPINVVSEYEATLHLPGAGIRKSVVAKYSYDVQTGVARSGDQEHRHWKYCLLSAKSGEVSVVDALYYDSEKGQSETVRVERHMEHTVTRSYDMDKTHITQEVSELRSYDPGAPSSVPFAQKVERAWTWDDDRGYRGLSERTWTYEERDVGEADIISTPDGSPVKWRSSDGMERYILLPGYQTTAMVKRERHRQTDEIFDDDGNCVSRIERETDDNGLADMLARGLYGNLYGDAAKEAMTQLRALPQSGSLRITQVPGGSSISTEVGTMTQPGRRFRQGGTTATDPRRYIEGNIGEDLCPFLCSDKTCGVSETPGEGVNNSSDEPEGLPCKYLKDEATPQYKACPKYKAFKHLSGDTAGTAPVSPVVGIAGDGEIWTEKELYIDEDLSEDNARSVAQAIARNILSVKSVSRGIVETVTIPLDIRVHPDGGIMAVSHDFSGLKTTISYRPMDTKPPEYLMLLNTSSTAANVYAKESLSKGRSAFGRVVEVRPDKAVVILGGRPVSCTSAVRIKKGDNALVFLPPGSVSSGVVQAVMR